MDRRGRLSGLSQWPAGFRQSITVQPGDERRLPASRPTESIADPALRWLLPFERSLALRTYFKWKQRSDLAVPLGSDSGARRALGSAYGSVAAVWFFGVIPPLFAAAFLFDSHRLVALILSLAALPSLVIMILRLIQGALAQAEPRNQRTR